MSGLFGKRAQSATPQRLNGIQVNQSIYGNAIALCYGTGRVTLQLIDYVDFKAVPHSESSGHKGGGGGSTSSNTYAASLVGLLGEGPILDILAVFVDKAQTTLSKLGLQLFKGAGLQAPWLYMQQTHPDHALPYDHMAYIAGANFDLGSSAGLPNLSFEMKGLLTYGTSLDAEPSDFIVDYCTEPNHGAGFNYLSNLKGTNSYSAYCIAMDFLLSPQETTQRQGQEFIKEILQITNSNAVFTPGVGLRFVPYADQAVTGNGVTYTPNLAPVYSFTDLDYVYEEGQQPVRRSRIPAKQTFNIWTVEYLNRANQYNVDTETFRDEQDIAVNGVRVAPTVSLHSITRASVALTVATLLCQRNLYIRSKFEFKVRADFSLLEPMDYVAINDSAGGIVNQLVRIIETNDDEQDGFTITAEEMLVGPASAPQYDTELAQGYAANYEADPGSVFTPYIFTAPPALAVQGNGYEEWIAVCGISGLWGGADIHASFDNAKYFHVGVKSNPSRYGVLNNALPAGSDPDAANAVVVTFNSPSVISLDSATRSAADALRTPLLVDGEVIAYQNSTPLGNNRFSLSYLRRGLYGSTIRAHNAGSAFAVLDDAIWRMPFDPGYSGQPIWFKFVGFNYWGGGKQDISQVTAFQAFLQGQNHGQLLAPGATPLIARGDCVNVGSQIYKKPNSTAAWDSDCYSIDAFAGGCSLRFRAMQTTANLMLGLNSDPLTDQNYTSLDHVWYLSSGTAYIYESGVLIQTTRAFTTDDIFEIKYDGKFVTYFISGVQWRTVADPGKTFFLDCSFLSPGSGVDNVYFGALNPANASPFVARGNCRVSDESIQKVGGVGSWTDSDVYSLEGYPSCHVTCKANTATGVDWMVGLGTKPAQDMSYTSIDFAWHQSSGNNGWHIYENGAHIGGYGAVSLTDVVAITYDGTTVTYLKNTVVQRTVTRAGLTLFLDSSFYTPGAGVNTLQYGSTTQLQLTDTSQIGDDAASQVISVTGSNWGGNTAAVSPLVGSSQTVTIVATGVPLSIDLSGTYQGFTSATGTPSISMFIARDGIQLPGGIAGFFTTGTLPNSLLINPTPVAVVATDVPPAGTHTYKAIISVVGATGGSGAFANSSCVMTNYTIKVREYKR